MDSFENKRFIRILIIALALVLGCIWFFFIVYKSIINDQIWKGSEEYDEAIDIDNDDNYKLDLNDKGILDIGEIETIEINCVSTDIKIETVPEEKLKVQFKGTYFGNEKEKPTLEVSKRGKTAVIQVKYLNSTKFDSITLATVLEIELPENYNGKIEINTVSSDLDIGEIKVEELKIGAVSGDITIESLQGELYAQTISGDVKVNFEELLNDISFNTTSGELSIKVPDDSNFTFNLNTVSGEVDSDLPISFNSNSKTNIQGKVGNGQYNIKCSSVSGNINIDN
ncbi:DUF4097 family beta strand repeat-containing protein [Clostridium sp. DL1XJH146]